jgi:hypothetical protein
MSRNAETIGQLIALLVGLVVVFLGLAVNPMWLVLFVLLGFLGLVVSLIQEWRKLLGYAAVLRKRMVEAYGEEYVRGELRFFFRQAIEVVGLFLLSVLFIAGAVFLYWYLSP